MPFNGFLKIAEIPGESTDDKHRNEIDVFTFSWGITRARGRNGHAKITDFSIIKGTDRASPLLFDAACEGKTLPEAIFTAHKAGGERQQFLKYVFKEVIITSVQPSGVPGGEPAVPLESVSLDFDSVEITYTMTDPRTGGPGGIVVSSCNPRGD